MKLFVKQDATPGTEFPDAWLATGTINGWKYFALRLPLPQLKFHMVHYLVKGESRFSWHLPIIVITKSRHAYPRITIDWGYTPYKEFMAGETTR